MRGPSNRIVFVMGTIVCVGGVILCPYLPWLLLLAGVGMLLAVDAVGQGFKIDDFAAPYRPSLPIPKPGVERRLRRIHRQIEELKDTRILVPRGSPDRQLLQMQIDELEAVAGAVAMKEYNRRTTRLTRKTESIVRKEL